MYAIAPPEIKPLKKGNALRKLGGDRKGEIQQNDAKRKQSISEIPAFCKPFYPQIKGRLDILDDFPVQFEPSPEAKAFLYDAAAVLMLAIDKKSTDYLPIVDRLIESAKWVY